MGGNVGNLGRLHQLPTRGLPDWCEADGRLNVQALAAELKMSDKALYAQFKRTRVSAKRINAFIALSKATALQKDFAPLTHSDFAEFLAP